MSPVRPVPKNIRKRPKKIPARSERMSCLFGVRFFRLKPVTWAMAIIARANPTI
jgi:hypothetical protein